MLSQAIGGIVLSVGLFVTSTGAPDLAVALLSDTSCKESTRYDTANDTIRECDITIKCDDATNDKCKRRGGSYTEAGTGITIGVTFCSCHELGTMSGPPSGACFVWRKHKGTANTPECATYDCGTDGEGGGGGGDGEAPVPAKKCELTPIADVYPVIYKCECK